MKNFLFLILTFGCLQTNVIYAQAPASEVQDATVRKDAPVDVSLTDFKKNVLPHEIVIFRSQINNREYQGITGMDGKFSTRLPAGDRYEMFILGFKDSTSYNVLDIPAPQGNASYKNPFIVELQHQPAKTFILDNVNYETGKAELDEDSYPSLDELVKYLVRRENERIEIGGHTDNVGTPANNLKLSTERAVTVMQYLISKGINPERLEAKGYGLTMPIESNKTDEGRAINRRTEVKILD